ncbi:MULTISPECIES: hypothetical protein [Bartonella]|nr:MULTISPECIES: hypothetical protein [Bartonella]
MALLYLLSMTNRIDEAYSNFFQRMLVLHVAWAGQRGWKDKMICVGRAG